MHSITGAQGPTLCLSGTPLPWSPLGAQSGRSCWVKAEENLSWRCGKRVRSPVHMPLPHWIPLIKHKLKDIIKTFKLATTDIKPQVQGSSEHRAFCCYTDHTPIPWARCQAPCYTLCTRTNEIQFPPTHWNRAGNNGTLSGLRGHVTEKVKSNSVQTVISCWKKVQVEKRKLLAEATANAKI